MALPAHLEGEEGTILGYNADEPPARVGPSRLRRTAEAFKRVNPDECDYEWEWDAERRERRGVRRLCYATLGTVAGIASGAAGMATDLRTLRNAGIAVTAVSALYLIKRGIGYLIASAPGRGVVQ